VTRPPAAPPEVEPACFGGDPAAAALSSRQRRGGLVDPAAAAVAIDTGGREIADPGEPCWDIVAMGCEHRVAGTIRRNRHEEVGGPGEGPFGERPAAVEELGAKPFFAQRCRLLGGPAGAADDPARPPPSAGHRPR